MIEISDSLPILQVVSQTGRKARVQITIIMNVKGVSHSAFASHWRKDLRVISRSEVGQKFPPKASSPNGKHSSFFVLVDRPLEDVVCVGSPLGFYVDLLTSPCEEHSIEFGEQIIEVGGAVEGKDGDNLGSCHLHELDVGSSDVCVVVDGSCCWFVAFVGEGEDADDGVLIG